MTNQLIYLVNLKTMGKIFSNYVCFSKSPNFTEKMVELWQGGGSAAVLPA